MVVKEHDILYKLDKDFFFKANSEYTNYNKIKNKIEKLISLKKLTFLEISHYLDLEFGKTILEAESINSGKCENKKKTCSDFNIANYLSKCSEMSANFLYKKCKYSNSICQDVNKTCLEITSKSHDDICENAKVSDPNTKR